MKIRSSWVSCFGIFAGAISLAAVSGSASAAFFNIDARAAAPAPVDYSANDFEGGLLIDGNPFQIGVGNPASGSDATNLFTFNGTWLFGNTGLVSRTVYFAEPATPTVVSHILVYNFSTDGADASVSGQFHRAGAPGDLGMIPMGTLPEDIHLTGTDFFWGSNFSSAVVQTAVPTPSALMLLVASAPLLARRRR